jgi:hypothetical protein
VNRLKAFARELLIHATRLLDSDGDGRLEVSDIPGALAKAAALQATGLALAKAGTATFESIKAAADAGSLTSGGVEVTAADVTAAWERAKAPFAQAAAEARAEREKLEGGQ